MKKIIQNLNGKKIISFVVSGLLLVYWLVLMIDNGQSSLSPISIYLGIILGFSYLIFTLIQFFLLEKDEQKLFFIRFSISFLKYILVLVPLLFTPPMIYENSTGLDIFEIILYWLSFSFSSIVFFWENFFTGYGIARERKNEKAFLLCCGALVLLLIDIFALVLVEAFGGKLANAPAELSFFSF